MFSPINWSFLFGSDHYDTAEAKKFFEESYSHIYYIFFDNFVVTESDLKQRGM